MDPYDIFMLLVLAAALAWGAYKGFAWQVASLAAVVVSYLVALKFSDQLAPHLGETAPWNRFLAMLVLYLGTSLCIWIAFRFVSKSLDKMQLKSFDRQIGAIIGVAKGVLLCVVITFFAVTLSERSRTAVLESKSGYYISQLIDRTGPLMPPEVHEVLAPYLHELDERLDPAAEPEWTLEDTEQQIREELDRFGEVRDDLNRVLK
jgi:membrane protein required for colicin V production